MNGIQEKPRLRYAPIVNHRTGEPHRSRRKHQGQIWIYGLFNPDGICLYVGQTSYPEARLFGHCNPSTWNPLKADCQMRIIRACEPHKAPAIELQVMLAYKRQGQCVLNKNKHVKAHRKDGPWIYVGSVDKVFPTPIQAANYLECSPTCLLNQIRAHSVNIYQASYATLDQVKYYLRGLTSVIDFGNVASQIMTTTPIIERRKAHHRALEVIAATVNCDTPGLTLWRKLGSLERSIYADCEAYSSDASFGLARWEKSKERARKILASIFGGTVPKGVYINGDPRGHMLKLDCDVVPIPDGMERDWGGNGILAATID